jgi:anti-sigma factor RsiW
VTGCRAEALTALVDGALAHDDRDRVLAHLAGCAACRAEVEVQRRLKARLSVLRAATPEPSAQLLDRLRGLAVSGVEPARPSPGRPAGVPVGLAGASPVSRRPGDSRPPARPGHARSRRVRRTGAVGGGLLLAGVGLALVLGGPAASPASTPVDPGSDAFVVDFVSTTTDVPLPDPAGQAALLPRP